MNVLLEYLKIVRSYLEAAHAQVVQQWSGYSPDMGNASMNLQRTIVDNVIAYSLIAEGQKAWVLEYGKGSGMIKDETVNPFLEDYINGNVKDSSGKPLFNPERLSKAFQILGRPAGTYFDLDEHSHYTNGSMEGRFLEIMSVLHDDKYLPEPARLIITNILGTDGNGLVYEMQCELQTVTMRCLTSIMQLPKKMVLM